jgi:hypothetical protein
MRCGIIEDRFKVFDGKELEDDMKANKFSFIRYSGMPNDKQSIVHRLLQNNAYFNTEAANIMDR